MNSTELSAETQKRLARLAMEQGCTVDEVLEPLLNSLEASSQLRRDPLVSFTLSPEFRTRFSDADRYLGLLAWIAERYPSEFRDLVEHADSGRRYLAMTPEQIRATCRHNQARQIPGTRYWAITNLDTASKRRFLRRLLVFVGTRDEVIDHVLSTIGRQRAA